MHPIVKRSLEVIACAGFGLLLVHAAVTLRQVTKPVSHSAKEQVEVITPPVVKSSKAALDSSKDALPEEAEPVPDERPTHWEPSYIPSIPPTRAVSK